MGGAEICNSLAKVQEAAEDALVACAGVIGATCHICGKGRDEGPLARGCSCRGTEGFVHLNCLAEVAHAAFRTQRRWTRWTTSLEPSSPSMRMTIKHTTYLEEAYDVAEGPLVADEHPRPFAVVGLVIRRRLALVQRVRDEAQRPLPRVSAR